MKRLLLSSALLVCMFAPFQAMADEFKVDSELTSATVYTNRATLTRKAEVQIPAGSHTVVFEGLPAFLLPDSLRAEGSASAKVTFGALSHKNVMASELIAPKEKELNGQLENLQDQRKLMELDQIALKAKIEFMQGIGKQAIANVNEDIEKNFDLKTEQWTGAADTIYKSIAEALKAQQEITIKIRDLDQQIQKVRNELAQLRTGQRSTYQVTVPLEVASATRLTVELSYQLPNASWRPLYDARLDTESGELELIQYGAVRQTTGEDWNDIALTLSTAQPQRGASLPGFNPMWVNIWDNTQNERRKFNAFSDGAVMSAAPMMMKAEMAPMGAPMDDMALEEVVEADFARAEINTGGFVSEYVIKGPSTVLADGTESKLLVGSFETESKLQVHVKPQLSSDAGLVSRVKLKGDAPVLPGQVSLFRDGAFVGQTHMALLRPDEESELSFGIDDQVSVEYHVMKDEKGEAGVIKKDNEIERQFKTVVRNLHNKPVEIVLYQNVPVPQNEDIKLEILKNVTTQGYKNDTDNIKGLLSWTKTPAAKEEWEVGLGWKVSWPSDHSISGL